MSFVNNQVHITREVKTTLKYLGDVTEPLFTYAYDAPPGQPKTNVTMMPRPVVVHDARRLSPAPDVDREGFALVRHRSAGDFYDDDQVRRSITLNASVSLES